MLFRDVAILFGISPRWVVALELVRAHGVFRVSSVPLSRWRMRGLFEHFPPWLGPTTIQCTTSASLSFQNTLCKRYRNWWRPVTHKVGALRVISRGQVISPLIRGYNPSYPFIRSFLGFITTRTIITSPPCSRWLFVLPALARGVGGKIAEAFRPICRRQL